MKNIKTIVEEVIKEVILDETYKSIEEIKELAADVIKKIAEINYKRYNHNGFFDAMYGANLNSINTSKYSDLKDFIEKSNLYFYILRPEKLGLKGEYGRDEDFNDENEKSINVYVNPLQFKEKIDQKLKETNNNITANDVYFIIFYSLYNILIHEIQHAYDDFRSKGKTFKTKEYLEYKKKYLNNKIKDDQFYDIEKNKAYLNLPHEIWARFSQTMRDLPFYTFDIENEVKIIYSMFPINKVVDNFKRNFSGFEVLTQEMQKKLISKVVQFWHFEKEKIDKLNIYGEPKKQEVENINEKNLNSDKNILTVNEAKKNNGEHRFTLTYTEGNQRKINIPEGFNTVEDAKKWADSVGLSYYLFNITEWDLNNLDFFGIPEIILTVNFEEPAEDHAEDLSYYSRY